LIVELNRFAVGICREIRTEGVIDER